MMAICRRLHCGFQVCFYPNAPARVEDRMVKMFLSIAARVIGVVLMFASIARAENAPVGDASAGDTPRRSVSGVVVQFNDGTQQTLSAQETATSAPTAATSDFPRPILGVNLESPRDYDRQFMFIDAMKTSRKWGSAEKPYDGAGPTGADGWPSGDAGTYAITEVKNINGVYKFSCIGRCDLSTPNSPAGVRNLRHDAAANRTEAEIVVNADADKIVTLILVFKNTDGGVKDVKLLRPGYASDAQIFTSEFINSLRPFDAIRFMDFLRTNNSLVRTWDDRCKVSDAKYTSEKGAPYEIAIALGNLLDKDIWLNVPALADDDFVRQLGRLIRDTLKPNLHCYVEYSNEVWNGQFKQYKQNEEAANAEIAAGDSTLNDAGADKNHFYWGWKRIAKRSVEISRLLRSDPKAPDPQSADPRIRMVLASQIGYTPPGAVIRKQLEYVARYHGEPKRFFFAVSGAPYFSPGKDETDPTKKTWYTQRTDVTVDAICQRLLARTRAGGNDNVKAFAALAKQYGLHNLAYEGGVDLQQYPTQVEVKIQSQYDPRTGKAVEDYLNQYYAAGGEGMFYFTLSCRYNKFGYWGLTEDVRELLTPKYLAAMRISEKLRGNAPPAK